MEKIVIEGGHSLKGMVTISGAKNAALPIIAACLLTGGWHRLSHVPRLKDIQTIKLIMSNLGVTFREEAGEVFVNSENVHEYEAPYNLVKTMRASILLLGPLLARLGKAKISLPGGCAIGARPINLHLKALAAMGVEMRLEQGYIHAQVDRLKGANIFFDVTTVRTDTIVIDGVKDLTPTPQHRVIPDRIEAGTFMIAATMTNGEITINGCRPEHLAAVIERLQSVGAELENTGDGLRVRGPGTIKSVDVKTMPFPGFPTDLQAQFMAMMCIAGGSSVIKETIFENRFIHVSELKRMGADIKINGPHALVRGKARLLAAPVMATDLRASASLILAGLVAKEGNTEVNRIYHLDRGYENLEEKFRSLGAGIWREKV
jgi:UDP-N-acetylglucosamine 1-carboxyvinyltransferase